MTARSALLVPSGSDVIGVEVCGDGPAVVLLHGSGGNRATWFQQVPDLARDHTVVVVETRGAGRSSDLAGRSGPIAGCEDLEEVRTHLGLERWSVIGHSLGGWTALRYAATHPERTTAVVCLSSLAGVFPPAAERFWERFTADLAAHGWPAQELGRPLSLTPGFCDARPELGYLYQLVGALNPPLLPTVPAARIREHDLTPEHLLRLTMPVAFVTGEQDVIAPPAPVAAAAKACGAGFAELSGAGHLALWEDPALVNDVLRAHLGV